MKIRFLIGAIVTVLIAAALGLASHFGWIVLAGRWFAILRWIAILLFACFARERKSLTVWILVGIIAGTEFGYDWPATALQLQVLGTIFLRLIKVIIAPLIFGTLVVGIAGHANLKKVGRMGLKAVAYFEIVSTLALIIGFVAISITRAGVGVHLPETANLEAPSAAPHMISELLTNIFPENIAKSVAEGQILQVVVFSVLFSVALAMVPEQKRRPLLNFAESLSETMFKFTNIVMLAAPVGVFGAMAYTVGRMGMGVLLPLLKLLVTMYGALAVFAMLVLLPICIVIGVPLRRFLKAVVEPVTIAFATSSSEAALPRAMEQMESLGVARETVAFVLPTGYTLNLDGSSLYQSIAVLFVAQAAGIHMSFAQQMVMLLTLLISSKGTAGVARASLVIVLGVVTSFHWPMEPVFLLFGIDQLMDMGRTAINVLGNCVATMAIARWESETAPFVHQAPEIQAR
ncbi:MAG TPA: cation:dicarboxylase symporter family transporter [Candidatus Eremiobacteraceae bacterium]|nr:cation:dicarboxylase symporter family transporter [Candidatus Eremiobacteraceae bacterium]